MIISHKFNLIFITTPKSGSHTGFKLMKKYFEAQDTGFNHSRNLPQRWRHYRTFTFVRNPYERFCALHHACVVNHYKPWVPNNARKSMEDYALWYAKMATSKRFVREDLTAAQHVWHDKTKINWFI